MNQLISLGYRHFFNFWKSAKSTHEECNKTKAQQWVDMLQDEEFDKLKKDIFRIIISTYYSKKFGHHLEVELSVYDVVKCENDLIRLNKLNNEGWRKVIKEMVLGTLEILDLFDNYRHLEKINLKVALINIPVLRRSSFKVVS